MAIIHLYGYFVKVKGEGLRLMNYGSRAGKANNAPTKAGTLSNTHSTRGR